MEETLSLEEKYVRIMKDGIKRHAKKEHWIFIYCLHGNQRKIEEVLWRLTISARKVGLDVLDLRKDVEALKKVIELSKGLEREEFTYGKVFITKMSDIPQSMDYILMRRHICGVWLIICDRDETECCPDYHFYFR